MSRLDLSKFFSPVASKLEAVEGQLQRIVHSDVPLVHRIGEHVFNGSGKRLRPALLLLASKFCGYSSDDDVYYAAIFELIHTATLIHDDVIDHAHTRRGRPSLNQTWGNPQSVLFGDFLYLQAVHHALEKRSWQIMELLTDVSTKMIEGELIQNEYLYNMETSRETYFDILERKTALMFAGCTKCGAILAGKEEKVSKQLFKFGLQLGRAFQLVDDLLDYISTEEHLGKPTFSDLYEGKLTLPMLSLLDRASGQVKPIVKRVWKKGTKGVSPQDAQALLELLQEHSVVDEVRDLAAKATREACDALPVADGDPEIAKLLLEIPELLLERTR